MTDTTETPAIAPLAPCPEALDFLLTRRSRSAKTLAPETPDEKTLAAILEAGARVPDHGKLVPWRFVVADRPAMARLEETARARGADLGWEQAAIDKAATAFTWGGAIVAVVSAPKPSAKIPAWEQELSAGAVCLSLVNAALALGWGANWLTGPLAREPGFLARALAAGEGETVAGFVHLGRETVVPAERDRPDLSAVVTRL